MMDLITIASVGMQSDQAKMDGISHNIANVLTPGYKRQVSVTPTFQAQMLGAQAERAAQAAPAQRISIDPSAGPMRHTGNTQDVAIEGDSFFEVNTPAGPAFTRQGSLRVDVQGRLVGTHGFPVLGNGGEIVLANTPFTIAVNGDVLQDGRVAGQLKRVRFESASAMTPLGNGLYQQGGARVADPVQKDPLRIGFQEGSNVSSPQEMVRMTETVRHFEALSKIVQGYDESLEKTIRKLGDF